MVIPIHDRNPARRAAVVTYALIAINVLVFLVGPAGSVTTGTSAAQACATQRYFLQHGAVPAELTSGHRLDAAHEPRISVQTSHGPVVCAFPALPHKSPVLSVLTAMFIHVGWLHLLGNMLFLFVFGNNVEDRLGRLHYLVFYLVGGYIATYAFAFLNPGSPYPLVGASGAIAAVLGAYLYLYPRAKVTSVVPFLFFLPLRFPAWAVLGSWFVLQLPSVQHVIGVSGDSSVAYLAHVAGFAAGFGYALLLFGRRRRTTFPPAPPTAAPMPWPGAAGPSACGPGDPYGSANPYPPRFPDPPR